MTRTRTRPYPDASKTLHCLGDLHFGEPAFTQARRDIVAADLARPGMPNVKYRLQLGDLVDNGLASEDAVALPWLAGLSSATPLYVVGNHDMWNGRTAAAAAAAWGAPGKDYTRDLGYAYLIVVGPDALNNGAVGCEYHAETQAWLDAALAAAPNKPIILAAHPPLMNTEAKLSSGYAFSAQPDAEIRAVLAKYSATRTIAWVSGHTHSPVDTANLAKAETIGAGKVLALNTSCLSHLSATKAWTDHLITFYLTVESDRWEVRFRNHGARQWVGGVGGSTDRRVWTMAF